MRIRKNLKLSAQSNVTPLICKLNQSSWDVMSSPPSTPRPPSPAPPPPPQVDIGIVSAGNESLDLLAAAAEMMELGNIEREQDNSNNINKNKNNDSTDSATKKPPVLESKSCTKNASASSDSDPYVFYMAFGLPGRGKRRGEHSDSGSKNLEQEHQLDPLYLDCMLEEDFVYNEGEEEKAKEKGKKKAKKSIKAKALSSSNH